MNCANTLFRDKKPSSKDKSLLDIFAIPLVLAVLTAFGLLAALLGEGDLWRYVSWAALTAPILVIIHHVAFGGDRRRRVDKRPPINWRM
jgi:hypothetical protein